MASRNLKGFVDDNSSSLSIGLECARYSVCGSSRGRKIDSFTINMWLKILSGILSAEVSEITVLLNWTAFVLDWQTKKDD